MICECGLVSGELLTTKKNIIVTGYADHGKDTVSEMLGLPYESSSRIALKVFLLQVLRDKYGLNYESAEEAYQDRDNHREIWYQEIEAYNTPNLSRLIAEVFRENDVYCGLRSRDQLMEARRRRLVDLVIWVDASRRKPPESYKSITISKDDCDLIIDNNGTKEQLKARVAALRKILV